MSDTDNITRKEDAQNRHALRNEMTVLVGKVDQALSKSVTGINGKIDSMNDKINLLEIQVAQLQVSLTLYARFIGGLIAVFILVMGWTMSTVATMSERLAGFDVVLQSPQTTQPNQPQTTQSNQPQTTQPNQLK